jgi:hypothetical protein
MKLARAFGADEWLFEREGVYFRLTREDVRWLMTATNTTRKTTRRRVQGCPCPHHPTGCYGHPMTCACATSNPGGSARA